MIKYIKIVKYTAGCSIKEQIQDIILKEYQQALTEEDQTETGFDYQDEEIV